MSIIYCTAILFFFIICIILCGVILMQEGKGGGLGASFGGDSGESVFGTSTADVLKKFTGWLAVLFFASCILLSLWTSAIGRTSISSYPAAEEIQG